ncbi:MAG: ThiF family adenylyltransferase, partial [Candidatus Heimdallarchaeota archaeon]
MVQIMHINDRYSRQIVLKNIQEQGQKKLAKSHVVVIGCGALGTTIANNLVRSGVGSIKIVDRDIVELNNLQRQNLFNENDVGLPKASVAAKKLEEINSEIDIEHLVDDVTYENVESIIQNMDLVLDGTDNMLIRFLINDACVKHDIPWIYGGTIETYGITMNIFPNKTPCFRCLIQDIPAAGSLPTCDTVGVLNSIPSIIGSIQSTEALKILLGKEINTNILAYDVWVHSFNNIKIKKNEDCECCGKHNFEFLNKKIADRIVMLCGSGVFQITPAKKTNMPFKEMDEKLKKLG